ncbi:hypothetical protein VTL71DRAFT_8402 [Oculimacula yallundae]|uniref:Uncharacterized protein n=1 Tax=Oculimacula yallundae TaxID=86028 RepID=A0ABR4CXI0_9HELO
MRQYRPTHLPIKSSSPFYGTPTTYFPHLHYFILLALHRCESSATLNNRVTSSILPFHCYCPLIYYPNIILLLFPIAPNPHQYFGRHENLFAASKFVFINSRSSRTSDLWQTSHRYLWTLQVNHIGTELVKECRAYSRTTVNSTSYDYSDLTR